MTPLARKLALLSADEMVRALGAAHAPRAIRKGLSVPFWALSRRLARTLAEMDEGVVERGLPAAAARALQRFGVQLSVTGSAAERGPCLVLANHPGAYDALALMAAIRRDDLLILAADRVFLRALPQLSRHLVFVGESAGERAGALKRALSCLRREGVVLHFPAGEIEPDADFEAGDAPLLKPWQPGVVALLGAAHKVRARVVVAGVRGVHSPRAKRFFLNRAAEQRGVSTLSPLLQMLFRLSDVSTHVHCADASAATALPRDVEHTSLREQLQQAVRHSQRVRA